MKDERSFDLNSLYKPGDSFMNSYNGDIKESMNVVLIRIGCEKSESPCLAAALTLQVKSACSDAVSTVQT